MSYVDFWVDGEPIAQGSMVSVGGNGAMRHSDTDLEGWRDAIGWAWKKQYRGGMLPRGKPVRMDVTFFVAMNATAKREKRQFPAVRGEGGDLDKLVRAVGDALEGLAWVDDAQVVHADALKLYDISHPQGQMGARIRLAPFRFGPPPWTERWWQLR